MIDIPKLPLQKFHPSQHTPLDTKHKTQTGVEEGKFGCIHGYIFDEYNDYRIRANHSLLNNKVLNVINVCFLYFGHTLGYWSHEKKLWIKPSDNQKIIHRYLNEYLQEQLK